jgi:gluconolactonase
MTSLFAPPERITAEVFAELPAALRKTGIAADRLASGRSVPRHGCFLEGPSFDRAGNLYVTDIPFGRVFRIDADGRISTFLEYDGEPNGLKVHRDGRLFIADYRNGLLEVDAHSGAIRTVCSGYNGERFRGLNDLVFADNGDLYFTDQGQTGLNDPSGRVFRLTTQGRLELVAAHIPSPNGLVLSDDQRTLWLAVTRANAIWRLPLTPDGAVTRMGVFIQMSGGRGPDGVAIDDDGGLAVAHPDMGCVWLFDRRGEPRLRIDSPKSDIVTNIAYGGADRRTLYIIDSEAGCVLRAPVPVAGRAMYSHR